MSGPIDAVEEHGTAPFEISSPRSLRALSHCALTCGQLQFRSLEYYQGDDVPKKVAKMRFESEEALRQRRMALVKKEYRDICRAEYDENVDIVLSDLALGVEKYICDRSDIYHPEVAVELKHVVVVAGRCYKRKKVPEGSQTPGLKQIAHELHDSVREVAVRDGLVPEAAEWEKVPLKVGREQVSEVESVVDQSTDERFLCVEDLKTQYYLPPSEWGTLKQRYGTSNTTVSILEDPRYRREKTPVHPRSTEIQELMRQLPDASFEECDDALLRTGDLDDASDLLREKFAEIRFGLRPVDATAEMSARVAEPVDHCLHCGTDCKWNTRFTCARCRTRTYCSRECMREDWLAEHSVQCVVLLPLLNSASSYGLSASGRFRAVAPRKAMPALWHSTENKLTHLYGLQDWSGVVELEHDVSLAARAVLADWPEVSLAMYSMLADCRRALGNNDQVILWHERCIEAARHVGNDELEAKTLASVAEFSQSVKNYHKAIDLLKLSLPLWSKAADNTGEGKALTSLGSLYARVADYDKAIHYYEQSLAQARQVGDTAWEEHVLHKIAVCFAHNHQYDKVLDSRTQCKPVAREHFLHARERFLQASCLSLRSSLAGPVSHRRPQGGEARGEESRKRISTAMPPAFMLRQFPLPSDMQ